MGDKRGSDYINLGALYGASRPDNGGLLRPDPMRGPVFVSHEETLRRELAIINARIAAELGPLPMGGLPAVPKRRIDAKGRLLPALTSHETTEANTMKLNQMAAAAAITVAMAACEPTQKTEIPRREASWISETKRDGAEPNISKDTLSESKKDAVETSMNSEFHSQDSAIVTSPTKKNLRKSFNSCVDASEGITFDMMNCLGVELEYQDKRLNDAYKRLHTALAARDWERLKEEQREWLRGLNSLCDQDVGELGGGTAQALVFKDCILDRTAKRADELENILAESSRN